MSNLDKNMNATRRRLLYPNRDMLDDGPLAEYVLDTIDEMVTMMNQTKKPLFIAFSTINLEPAKSVYPLDSIAIGFGKARYLYTQEPTNRDARRKPIEIVEHELLTEMYGAGDPTYGPAVFPAAAAFFYQFDTPGAVGGNFVEFGPVPNGTGKVILVWEPQTMRPQQRDNTSFHLEQFDALIAARTALRALPHCEWKGLSSQDAAARRAELSRILQFDIGSIAERRGLEFTFWMWRQSNNNRIRPNPIGWAENRR